MTILIPAYEPDQKLIQLVMSIKEKCNYKIVIVDDGSGEKYRSIFSMVQDLGCKLISYKQNMGKGYALKTGFKYIKENGEDEGVACADCDGQHKVDDIIEIARQTQNSADKIILGSRKFKGKVPFRSVFGNIITKFMFFIVTGINIHDTQTGLRGYNKSMLNWLCSVRGERYEYEFNILLHAKEEGYGLIEKEIETVYLENNESSHFNPVKDSLRIYIPLIKFAMSSFSSAIIDFILLFLFKYLTDNLLFSVVFARVFSSTFNYFLNKNLVFGNNKKISTTAPKYFSLAAVILGCNYGIIYLLNDTLGLNLVLAKILTETVLFIVSYIVQHKFVFSKKN